MKRSYKQSIKQIFTVLLVFAMLAGFLPPMALASGGDGEAGQITIQFSMVRDGKFEVPRQEISVTPGLAGEYGYAYGANVEDDQATALDAVVAMHEILYGESEVTDNLTVNDTSGMITRSFGETTNNIVFKINDDYPRSDVFQAPSYVGYTINEAVIAEGDFVAFYFCEFPTTDDMGCDYHVWFEQDGDQIEDLAVTAGEAVDLVMRGYPYAWAGHYGEAGREAQTTPVEGAQLGIVNAATGEITDLEGIITDEEGNLTIHFDTPGTYILTATGTAADPSGYDMFDYPILPPWLVVTVRAGEAESAAPHGYLGGITMRRSSRTVDTRPPLMIDPDSGELAYFEFDPAVTEYDLVYPLSSTYAGSTVVFTAELADTSRTGLYGRFFEIGADSSRSLIAPSSAASFNPISNFPNGIWNNLSGTRSATDVFIPASLKVDSVLPRTIVLQVGAYDNTGDVKYNSKVPVPVYTDVDEYTFNIRRQADISGFAVYREVGGAALPGSAFNTDSDLYEYLAIGDGIKATDTVYVHVNQPATAVNTQLYFKSPGGDWVKGVDKDGGILTGISTAANAYKLDLTGYLLDAEDGAYHIPVKIVCKEDTGGVDSFEYTLKIAPYDYSVVFSEQPVQVDGTFEKNGAPTYTVNVQPVQGENAPQGELSYQWYGSRSDTLGQPIPGATEASFTPTDFFSGKTYFTCQVTRTIGDAAFTTSSDRVNATLALTYLTPVQFRETPVPAAGFKYVCEAGQDPGTVSYSYWSADTETTLDNAATAVDVYIRPAGSVEHGEKVGSGGNLSYSGVTSAFGLRYNNGTALLPGYAQAGEFEYYILITAQKEGFETVYTASDPIQVTITPSQVLARLDGEGTEESPYQIKNAEDLNSVCALVNAGSSLTGVHFKLTNNITLPAGWTPIGALKPGATGAGNGSYMNPFSGILDGDGKTVTVPDGGKPLFGYVRAAKVKNLNIYGTYIDGYGLVNNYTVDYGASGNYIGMGKHPTIDIVNVTIKSGTTVKYSGFLGGFASGANLVNISGCTVEDGVIIGWNKDANAPGSTTDIGSFGGSFNGTIINSISHATVYGNSYVGGLIGSKGQSMGPCDVYNSEFHGEITATGNYVGGIVGGGYSAPSAPNMPGVTIENCYAAGTIKGASCVGGLFGGEPMQVSAWENGIGYICNNHFVGTIEAAGSNVGGIIGYMNSLNNNNVIENNYYSENCGAEKGIGLIRPEGIHGRDDDPAGADAHKLAKLVTAEYMASADIVEALNAGTGSWQNWIKDDDKGYPVHDLSAADIIYKLTVGGDYKSIYYIGDSFDPTGIAITAHYTAGAEVVLTGDDVEFSGFDSGSIGDHFITVTYEGVSCEFLVNVVKKPGTPAADSTISVRIALIGSSKSLGGDIDLADGDYDGAAYELWIPMNSYKLEKGTTLLELFVQVLDEAGLAYNIKSMNNYVEWIRSPYGVKMGEFTNGPRSGWMYSVGKKASGSDGKHPDLGLREYALKDGDVIIWHYVNDFSYEVHDWFDEHDYPSLGDGTYYSNWLKALSSEPSTGSSPDDSATLAPKVTASNGTASVAVSTSDMASAISAAQKNNSSAIVITPEITGEAKKVSVEVAKASLSSVSSDTDADLKIVTPNGSVTIPNDALDFVAAKAEGSTISVVVEAVESKALTAEQQKLVGDNAVFDVSILSGGKAIGSFGGKSIAISLPYTLKTGESADGVTVWYLDDSGKLTRMACTYDKKTGLATFSTDHLSHYAVGYDAWQNPFTDVKTGDWYYDAVKYAVQNELFNGTSATTFSPNAHMTRAMLVTALYRLEGKPAVTGTNAFSDMKSGEWYTDAVIWANANGIVTGYGSGTFGTSDPITREQMAAMLLRYASFKKYDAAKANDLSAFTDAGSIASYALAAMQWANAEGLITGRTATTLAPAGTATRAEVATILMRFAETVAK